MKNYEVFGIKKVSAELINEPNLVLKFGDIPSAEAFAEWLKQEAN